MEELKDNVSAEAFSNLQTWLTHPEFVEFVAEIKALIRERNYRELEDAFYGHIKIGTAGIRGKVGVGPNRINLRTIGEAAQGLANFIKDFGQAAMDKGVVVGHEVRKQSRAFAELTCSVLAANGIKAQLFEGIRSTPEVSFAVRHLSTIAGVQLTASHNTRNDNGFKFFWTDGGQVVPPLDQKFMGLVRSVSEIKKMDFGQAKKAGLIGIVAPEVDEAYLQKLLSLSLITSRSARIAFSPMHSAGMTNVLPVLKRAGFEVLVVPQQAEPDENFPTAIDDTTNPEFEKVMKMAIKLGEKTGADAAFVTDPDACRLGVAVKTKLASKKLTYVTANEVASAVLYFLLSRLKEEGRLASDMLFIKTYCSTTLATDIAKSFGIRTIDDLLVGYKWVGQTVGQMQDSSKFIFSFEDTCGYSRGDFMRDKDAAIGALTIAELISYLKDQGKTLTQYLDMIYEQYGYYRNVLYQVESQGKQGFEDIVKIYKGYRAHPPMVLGGLGVVEVFDRLPEEARKPEHYKAGATGDELSFILSVDQRNRLTTRPSGTQPQFKYYLQVFGKVDGNLKKAKKAVDALAEKIEKDFYKYQDGVLGRKERGVRIRSNW